MLKRLFAYALVSRSDAAQQNPSVLEARQKPDASGFFNDSFYFSGRDTTGNALVLRLGFRPQADTEIWFDLMLPQTGRVSGIFPDATSDISNITCGPLHLKCVEPNHLWKITYNGPVRTSHGDVPAEMELSFSSTEVPVDFKAHTDSWGLAGYMAQEKWSREWFEKLRDLKQIHYEQGGTLTGTISLDGTTYPLELRGVRDHSFGPRKWQAMQEHAWLMACMEDGSFINVSTVSYDFLPYMHSGYVARGGVVLPVTAAPRFQDIPRTNPEGMDFQYQFAVKGEPSRRMNCMVDEVFEYTMHGVYHFYEGLARFDLDGKKGVGICEIGKLL